LPRASVGINPALRSKADISQFNLKHRESVESVLKKNRKATLRWEGFAEKEGCKPEIKSEGVMDDESGESMEPM